VKIARAQDVLLSNNISQVTPLPLRILTVTAFAAQVSLCSVCTEILTL